jgi:hypothetical protein
VTEKKPPKILLLSTWPYKKTMPSRAFASYFHDFSSDSLACVYCANTTPDVSNIANYWRITDSSLLKSRFKKTEIGSKVIPCVPPEEEPSHRVTKKKKLSIPQSGLRFFFRDRLWQKKRWATPSFLKWTDEFAPELIVISGSNDFFLYRMGLFLAKRYNAKMLLIINDDYLFLNENKKPSGLFFRSYRKKYKRLISSILSKPENGFCGLSESMVDRYKKVFAASGLVVPLSSESNFSLKKTHNETPTFVYCGNVSLGRYRSLESLANYLKSLNKPYRFLVYSSEEGKEIEKLKKSSSLSFMGSVSYAKVVEIQKQADFLVYVESFKKKDIVHTRYSVSTKVPNLLSFAKPIICYGPKECSAIKYFSDNKAAYCCDDEDLSASSLVDFLSNNSAQTEAALHAKELYLSKHQVSDVSELFLNFANQVAHGK